MSTKQSVWIEAIASCVPQRAYTQDFALEFMSGLPLYGDKERNFLRRIYRDTGIARRHTVIEDYGKPVQEYEFFAPNESLLPEPAVAERNELFVRHAETLSARAVGALFDAHPHVRPQDVTHLITVTCTGFSAPGFDYQLVRRFSLSSSLHRYHIGFMGCYAGFPAMKLAHTICNADPSARVLIVDVELCSLHFQFKPEADTMVANSLFADGAAAALVSTTVPLNGGYRLVDFCSRIITDSDEAMSWRLGNTAFDMRLSAYVPRLLQRDIGGIVAATMEAIGLSSSDVKLWAIHPGGRAILDRVAEALQLPQHALQDSYAVLRDYGNMSSATIFFVLQRMLQNSGRGLVFAAAFGPGLTVESACLERV
ncbi:MAG: type III polyketide synthase [Spirochaetaceae bacterium]|nr:MAG: type III polyketide synthase [Spirochaetaceae bacterium]